LGLAVATLGPSEPQKRGSGRGDHMQRYHDAIVCFNA
jgi:hypothetical protein